MVKRYRSGPWSGIRFSGAPELRPNPIFGFSLISNEDEVYYTYELYNESILSRLVLNESSGGVRQRFTWTESHGWQIFFSAPRDRCDNYGLCGAYGTCDQDETTVCQCLKGFKPSLLHGLVRSLDELLRADILIPPLSISGGQALVSQSGTFELGFLSPCNSKNCYLGMWYKKIPVRTVLWVANRENPLTNSSAGILKINDKGNLVLVNRTESVIWSSNSSKAAENPVVQLLESGNLILRDEKRGNSESYVWQSFDYPSDTITPTTLLPEGLLTGIENEGYPEAVTRKDMVKRYRSGPWSGIRFSGAPELRPNPIFGFSLISNEDEVEVYYTYELYNESILSRLVLNESSGGVRQRLTWTESHGWQIFFSVPRDRCDNYGLCGAYGTCDQDETTVCQCLKGFKPSLLHGLVRWVYA
ncbi:hypothetical protein HHK36_002035 [Tetracentron sinense]|uniref:Bulb-type lectin domain-containing protein n=1 Tax=Tetracentron sinense TaxID=13715 RepID=A0A835A3T4_TETSI|nr:hypothetical protein HHK36_002035 [Tetracentron sinense]